MAAASAYGNAIPTRAFQGWQTVTVECSGHDRWIGPNVVGGGMPDSVVDSSALRVFLCHASEDKPFVRQLAQFLSDSGCEVWFDELKLVPGQDWKREIRVAVFNSDAVIVVLSERSVDKVGFVQTELRLAQEAASERPDGYVFIIPVRLDGARIPSGLEHLHWLDVPSPGWLGRLYMSLSVSAETLGRARPAWPGGNLPGEDEPSSVLDFDWNYGATIIHPRIPSGSLESFPQIAAEDFLSIRLLEESAVSAGCPPHMLQTRGSDQFDPREPTNLFLLGSPLKDNLAVEHILRHPATRALGVDCRFVTSGDARPRIQLILNETVFDSPSYDQEIVFREEGAGVRQFEVDDFALVAKVPNPHFGDTKAVITAGIRAFGTWGASQWLRDQVKGQTLKFGSQDFVAVLRVRFENHRVVTTEIVTYWQLG